jgi:uncharacterized membrane protein
MKMSLTFAGLWTIVAGTFLVNTLGITESCSTELTSKAVEYGPMVVGSIMAAFGRYRQGGVNVFGVRK